jgi:hypothetical protein
MAYSCNAGGGCSITGCSRGCFAMRVHKTGFCRRGCEASPLHIPGTTIKLKSDDIVSVSVRHASLSEVAAFMEKVYPKRLALPAKLATKRVSLSLKGVPLSRVVHALGLLIR